MAEFSLSSRAHTAALVSSSRTCQVFILTLAKSVHYVSKDRPSVSLCWNCPFSCKKKSILRKCEVMTLRVRLYTDLLLREEKNISCTLMCNENLEFCLDFWNFIIVTRNRVFFFLNNNDEIDRVILSRETYTRKRDKITLAVYIPGQFSDRRAIRRLSRRR